jgi:riboflavin synthase
MFTGIVTDIGTVIKAEQRGDLRLTIRCGYAMDSVAIGASIACSGVCLTVVDKGGDWFAVDVSGETVSKTASDLWCEGARLNLERSLRMGDELGGHIVTGPVDGVADVVEVKEDGGSHRAILRIPDDLVRFVVTKGSITLDGVSLTVNDVQAGDSAHASDNIIPHTAQVTTFDNITEGRQLNVEIDVLARYIDRMLTVRTQ